MLVFGCQDTLEPSAGCAADACPDACTLCLQCEHQVKRTSVAVGQAHPVWKEEVNFKSVQITSDLQVGSLPPSPYVSSSLRSFNVVCKCQLDAHRGSSPCLIMKVLSCGHHRPGLRHLQVN